MATASHLGFVFGAPQVRVDARFFAERFQRALRYRERHIPVGID